MNFAHDGLSLWYATPDAPAPPEEVARGCRASLTIGVRPPSPANTVDVLYRVDGGFVQRAAGWELRTDYARELQYFRAAFPAFPRGDVVEYCPVLGCAGRQVPQEEIALRLPSKFRLSGGSERVPSAPPRSVLAGKGQAFPELEYLSHVTVKFDKPEVIGDTPQGVRINYWALGGTMVGPKLRGVVLPRSGDSFFVRRDGVGVIRVRATFKTDDGAMLSSEYDGSLELGENGYERALVGQFLPLPDAVVAPRFMTGHPKYAWLNRLQCIGVGRVRMEELFFEFDLFAIRPGGSPKPR
jgi:hypothetical protein